MFISHFYLGQSTPDPPKSAAGKKIQYSKNYYIYTVDRRHTEGIKSKRKGVYVQQFAFNHFSNMKIDQTGGRFSVVESTHKKPELFFNI